MPGAGGSGWGQGGLPNVQPSRTYREYGSDHYRDEPDDWVGGARGPAALPSRTSVASGPARSQPLYGQHGAISFHRGAYVEDAGAPRLDYSNELYHNHIPWSRPVYPNVQGILEYKPPSQMPSWTADSAIMAGGPSQGIPVQNKKIGNFTVRRPFGDSSGGVLFPGVSLAPYVSRIRVGMTQQGRRWMRQAKTHNPVLVNRSVYATAGSYGQTTATLPTKPTNMPGGGGMFAPY